MKSDPIVIAFDATEGFRSRLPDRFKYPVFDQFRFETGKETFGLGIVLTIAFPAH
jgi:hypothetical protein